MEKKQQIKRKLKQRNVVWHWQEMKWKNLLYFFRLPNVNKWFNGMYIALQDPVCFDDCMFRTTYHFMQLWRTADDTFKIEVSEYANVKWFEEDMKIRPRSMGILSVFSPALQDHFKSVAKKCPGIKFIIYLNHASLLWKIKLSCNFNLCSVWDCPSKFTNRSRWRQ